MSTVDIIAAVVAAGLAVVVGAALVVVVWRDR